MCKLSIYNACVGVLKCLKSCVALLVVQCKTSPSKVSLPALTVPLSSFINASHLSLKCITDSTGSTHDAGNSGRKSGQKKFPFQGDVAFR